ncbi:MAG: hypothetical protein COU10_01335 [Candidatus Harrisonbacteria bacterium CG10_big_fil_rev_8_21_14_0_10_45_28]|uniref:bAvd-like domain-containing protein n=1 Tax=Candidatus Harrisonbacteria bacterium CG10_big_fil_rev_8_21_14_0_10_45_28 TaxID=1974586 RepID=A0A2H0UNU2_9BACT|nr:MAG: hypothetical protein COU10_01335 [Candidatus Harrisonbacteria bacterium CG10_big_fil_rev_8_21_14_0_10_45_28]
MPINNAPPPNGTARVIHSFEVFYKSVYQLSDQLPKRDRFGIWATIEQVALEVFALLIEAAFLPKATKQRPLLEARVKIEVLKRLIRTTHSLNILPQKHYLLLEQQLIAISKEVGGWIKFLQ